MTEQEDQQRLDSPLQSERGSTTIEDGVVSRIAGMAAREVEGVYMGGSASRAVGGVLGGITGSDSQKRGVSVEVGSVEVAIDLTMGVEYGRNILELVERVRNRIAERVESLTGLRVAELNVTVSDIVFPDGEREEERRTEPESGPAYRGPLAEDETAELRSEPGDQPQVRQTEETGPGRPDAERVDLGAARAEAMTRSGRRFGEEMLRPQDEPPEEDETKELRLGDEGIEERPPAGEDEAGSGRRREE